MNFEKGTPVVVTKKTLPKGKGLSYPYFIGVMQEDGSTGGWDVYDVKDRANGIRSVYGFSIHLLTKNPSGHRKYGMIWKRVGRRTVQAQYGAWTFWITLAKKGLYTMKIGIAGAKPRQIMAAGTWREAVDKINRTIKGGLTKNPSQTQMFWKSHRQIADANELFMDMVRKGEITREELASNIKRRPALWGRYAGFLDKLPSKIKNPYSEKAKFVHVRLKSPKYFDKKSFRTISAGGKGRLLIVGRLKGSKTTTAQAILVPAEGKYKRFAGRHMRLKNPSYQVEGLTFEGGKAKSPLFKYSRKGYHKGHLTKSQLAAHRKAMHWIDRASEKGGSYEITTKNPIAIHGGKRMAYCGNCGQWKYKTKAGYLDCTHECARRGFEHKRTMREEENLTGGLRNPVKSLKRQDGTVFHVGQMVYLISDRTRKPYDVGEIIDLYYGNQATVKAKGYKLDTFLERIEPMSLKALKNPLNRKDLNILASKMGQTYKMWKKSDNVKQRFYNQGAMGARMETVDTMASKKNQGHARNLTAYYYEKMLKGLESDKRYTNPGTFTFKDLKIGQSISIAPHFLVKRLRRDVYFLADDRVRERARFGTRQQIIEDAEHAITFGSLPEASSSRF